MRTPHRIRRFFCRRPMMTDYFALAKTICMEPYMRIEDEWDREKRWWDERDDAMYRDEEEICSIL